MIEMSDIAKELRGSISIANNSLVKFEDHRPKIIVKRITNLSIKSFFIVEERYHYLLSDYDNIIYLPVSYINSIVISDIRMRIPSYYTYPCRYSFVHSDRNHISSLDDYEEAVLYKMKNIGILYDTHDYIPLQNVFKDIIIR